MKDLQYEVDFLRWQLQQERIAREVVTSVTERSDKTLAQVLADAWRVADLAKEAHMQTTEEVAQVMKDCEYFRNLYEMAEHQRCQEMMSAKEAMRAVQKAQAMLAVVKEENEVLLDHLVKTKVDYANKCMDYDDLDKKYSDAVRLLVLAQQRIDTLDARASSRQQMQIQHELASPVAETAAAPAITPPAATMSSSTSTSSGFEDSTNSISTSE